MSAPKVSVKALLSFVMSVFAAVGYAQTTPASAVDFQADISPILSKSCATCHQGNGAPANLRLDSAEGLMAGGVSGKVVVPGKADESVLMKRISQSVKGMPPSGPLPEKQISLISTWINQGAQVESAGDIYTTSIKPILQANCYACHSGSQPKGQLSLDIKSEALKGGISGPVILPGDGKGSRLIHRVMGADGERQMPLGGKPLSAEQIAVIARWINEGAKWPDSDRAEPVRKKHWSYVAPVRPKLPEVRDTAWVLNPIDRFILARLEKERMRPSPAASKEKMIRRVTLDLTGLLPTPAEVDAFVADARPDAYEKLVDRLLASPKYGERWATPWLDLARYGDSDGWTQDHQRTAWPYRDWVIKALNNNMPFDQFTIEQLAGDMLPNATNEQKIATGFIRSSTLQTEPGSDPEENNWNAQLDRASTVGTVWMGSSIGCAQCHNHKYDPFTQKQFYQMVAFFSNSAYTTQNQDPLYNQKNPFGEPRLALPSPEQAKKLDEINVELQKYQTQLDDSSPSFAARQAAWERSLLDFENQWRPVIPTKLAAKNGTQLTAAPDGAIVASGPNPDSETYVINAKAPLREITGLRLEALPNKNFAHGGAGRDYYGNFMVRDVTVEAGQSLQQLKRVTIQETPTDGAMPTVIDDPKSQIKQVWLVAGVGDDRKRIQLLLIPKSPLKTDANGLLRITVIQNADLAGVNLGSFRISVTGSANPKFALDVPSELRPTLSIPLEKRTPEQAAALTAHYRTVAVELESVRRKIAELQGRIEGLHIPQALVMAENNSVPRPSAYVRMRGAFVSKGDLVPADVPDFILPMASSEPMNRLGLARWLVSKSNPLTARVTVNHFWQSIFGKGIVETSEDFGSQGFAPTHPELLDWLAVEFMENGWNMKALQRLIVTSATYRQSSSVTPEILEKDPANALLSRGPRFRVEAEMVRDLTLQAAGTLSSKMYGPPVKPPQPAGVWGWFPGSRPGTDVWNISPGEDRYRRAIYTFIRRSARYPSLTVFDAPSRENCIARRTPSNTPLQALTTLNDPAFFEAAAPMARRILKDGGPTDADRVTFGFRLVTSRAPQAAEVGLMLEELQRHRKHFENHTKEAESVSGELDANLAAWTMFSNSLLNLDETLTKE